MMLKSLVRVEIRDVEEGSSGAKVTSLMLFWRVVIRFVMKGTSGPRAWILMLFWRLERP